jgi:hypothetical protein
MTALPFRDKGAFVITLVKIRNGCQDHSVVTPTVGIRLGTDVLNNYSDDRIGLNSLNR